MTKNLQVNKIHIIDLEPDRSHTNNRLWIKISKTVKNENNFGCTAENYPILNKRK